MLKPLYLFFTTLLLFHQLTYSNTDTTSKLKIAYAGSEPFIFNGDVPEGIILDLWKEIAVKEAFNFELISYKSVRDGINAVDNNEVDMLIGPVTISYERAEKVAFSQPFYDTELAILAPIKDLGIWERAAPFFNLNFLYAVFGFLLVLTIVGFFIWLAERKKNEVIKNYKKQPVKGVGTGIWLALVTMTTVGYGDYAPQTIAGRFILGIWMLISLIMATSFVAGMASTLTASSHESNTITSINEVKDKEIAVPANEKLTDLIKANGGNARVVKDVDEGIKLLEEGNVDALIYDIVQLEYAARNLNEEDYLLSKKRLLPQSYGFAFPTGSELKREIDLQIIRLKERNKIEEIVRSWMGG